LCQGPLPTKKERGASCRPPASARALALIHRPIESTRPLPGGANAARLHRGGLCGLLYLRAEVLPLMLAVMPKLVAGA